MHVVVVVTLCNVFHIVGVVVCKILDKTKKLTEVAGLSLCKVNAFDRLIDYVH